MLDDLRYGFRTLVRTPGFTFIAAVVLAIGMGINATVFSVANALFLKPIDAANPQTLVRVYSNRFSNTRHATYVELRDRNSTLAGLTAFQFQSFGVRINAETERAVGELASGNYFTLLGITAGHGRLFGPADDRPEAPPVVVLADSFWKRRFNKSTDVIGKSLTLNGQPFTIVGIAREGFTGVLPPLTGDLWVPLSTDAVLRPALDPAARLASSSFHLIGRLKPGVDRHQSEADLDTIGRQLRAAAGGEPSGAANAVSVYPGMALHPELARPAGTFIAVLMFTSAVMLLIVCVNVANLVLARATGREGELALRQSIGAGRWRLVRQLLTENLILACAGAVGGLAIAVCTTRALMAVQLTLPVPVFMNLAIDWRVLLFTVSIMTAAVAAFGVLPALRASKTDLLRALKGVAADGQRHSRLRSAFLVTQVAMSVLLLVVAGLFVRGFYRAQSIDIGFDPENVLTASVDLEPRGYTEARGIEFARMLVERLEASPGILSANLVEIVPVTLSNSAGHMLRDGDEVPGPGKRPTTPLVYMNSVSPGHFETLKIPLVSGRDFTYEDRQGSTPVAVVNETLARRFWPGKNAVGQRLRPIAGPGGKAVPIEIVGVARDSKYITVGEEPTPFMYRPLAHAYTPHPTLLVRSGTTEADAVAIVRREVQALDAGLPVFNVATMVDATSISLLPARVAGRLLAALGAFALLLAAIGVYGVLSFLVGARTREIGVRMAVGADPRAVVSLVVRQAMVWTIGGAAIGVALALVVTRFLASFLYGVSPTDVWTFTGVLVLIGAVSYIAALVPAIRASRVDPVVALRSV